MCFGWLGSSIFQNVILVATLIAAIYVGRKQNEINNNILENNIRPVILRNDFFNYNNLISTPNQYLSFEIDKNIAFDIKGHVVVNKKKYKLRFTLAKSSEEIDKKTKQNILYSFGNNYENFGWIKQGNFLRATFDLKNYEDVDLENQIRLDYKDIGGNSYYTLEDKDYKQKSKKL